MEQLKYINVVEILQYKGTDYEQPVKIMKQIDHSYTINPDADELFAAESKGEKLIEVPSDDYKKLLVRIDDIVNVYVVENPEYEEEEVE